MQRLKLNEIAETSRRVGESGGRLDKIAQLAACLGRLAPDEVRIGVAYLSGELPQGRIGIGPSMLRSAMPVASALAPSLELVEVDETFTRISEVAGSGSTAARVKMLGELFARATDAEQELLARLITGELRHGALEGVVTEAVARAANLPAGDVRRALMVAGDLSLVAEAALSQGKEGLAVLSIQLFRPLQPMLAQTAEDPEEALQRLGEASIEYKLDGARVQVHKSGGDVRVFSRRLNEVTPAVPEVVEQVRRLPAKELILDGETIALRPDLTPHPFQVTMRRFGRKLDVARMQAELPLRTFYFDCLYLDGEALIDAGGRRRFAALSDALPEDQLMPRIVTASPDEAGAFFERALADGHEGVMAKAVDAPYEAGRRGIGWLKLKPAHTLDLVVLAVDWGHGRRQGWLSNLHLGARDPAKGGFVMLGKTFKGMTDAMLEWQTTKLLTLEIGRDVYTVHVRPELVVEIALGGVQSSPQYPGGVALRFARVKRYREDKRPEDADTIDAVRKLMGTTS